MISSSLLVKEACQVASQLSCFVFLSQCLCCNAGELERQRQNLPSEISVDPDLLALLRRGIEGEERIAAHDFFLTLAACNTVIPMVKRNPCPNSSNKVVEAGEIDYQGESPDEQALVVAASSYGYTLLERTTGHVVVNVNGKKIRYMANSF